MSGRLAKSFFVFSYPRYLTTAWLSSAINLDVPMDIAMFVHPIDTGFILKQLRRRVTEVQSELMDKEAKGLVRDPELETAFQDLEGLRDRLQTAQEKMFRFGLYLTVYGETQEELRAIETTLRSIFESRLLYIKPALYQQKEGFNSCLPYGRDLLGVHTSLNTEPLSSTFPFVSFDLSSNEGILYGINRHNNSLILFDRFSLENANEVIFAKSGSGKSVVGSEPVLVKTKGGIHLEPIGPLVEKIIEQRGATNLDEELEGVIDPGIEVYSFDKNMKGAWSKVTVAARKEAPALFYKFATRSGREITTTGDHNLVVLRNGKIEVVKSTDVEKGEFIPLPRSVEASQDSPRTLNLLTLLRNSEKIYIKGAEDLIRKSYGELKAAGISCEANDYLAAYKRSVGVPIKLFWRIIQHLGIDLEDEELAHLQLTQRNNSRQRTNIHFPINDGFLKLLGFIAAEGYINKNFVAVSNIDKEVLNALETEGNSLKKLGILFHKIINRRKARQEGIVTKNRVFVEMVKALGASGHCDQKQVCPFIFSLEKGLVARYLSAYFEGDGCVDTKNIAVFAASTSKRLATEIAYLLYYFGIVSRVHASKKREGDTTRKNSWRITISGQRNLHQFAEYINFISKQKKLKLARITNRKEHTAVDFIPNIEPILGELHELLAPQLHHMRQFQDWKNGKKRPSPQELLKVIGQIEKRVDVLKSFAPTFRELSDLPIINSQGPKTRSLQALETIGAVNGELHSLGRVKETIRLGFRELDLSTSYYHRTLEPRHAHRDTLYQTIRMSSMYVWQSYQEMLAVKIPRAETLLAQLKTLANADLFWDPIVKVEEIENKKERHVYDLTVDNEVFLAGTAGMFVHNSYAVKLEVLRSLMTNVDAIILDPENEYKPLAEAVGGSFFDISLGSENHINPFDLPTPREDEKPEDVLRSNIINLVGLMRIMLGGLTPEEDAIMDRALAEAYAAKDITVESDPATWNSNIPLMEDLEQVLAGMEGTESLVTRLRKFTKGTYANFFNQPTNISLDKSLISFGIRDMEEGLRPMAMYIIMRYIWNIVRSELKKRIFVLDEAWWLMQTEDGASFLYGLAKRARKYYLGVTTITQDVGDFMKSSYGRPIITNSSIQILMKQSPATIDVVQKAFNLTQEEKNLLLETEVGEGIFFAGQKHVAIKVVASPKEHEIITTSPEELLRRKQQQG